MIHDRPCFCEACTAELILEEPPDHVYDFAVTADGAIVVAYMGCSEDPHDATGYPTVEIISHCTRTNTVTRMWRSYVTGDLAHEVFLQHADRTR